MSDEPKPADTSDNKQPTKLPKFRDGLFGCGCLVVLVLGFVSIIESVWGVAAHLLGVDRKNTLAFFIFLMLVSGLLGAN